MGRDYADLLFRFFFCLIFVGLGGEHLFDDSLIQLLMPDWVPYQRFASVACGVWLVTWGTFIMIGYRIQLAAVALALFLIVVTGAVHLPGVMNFPPAMHEDCHWLWTILQRTNLVKNLCLLGVCFHLLYHDLGRFSIEHYLAKRAK